MLPDNFENLGQSIVATVGVSNNILLWLTSGYWDLANEYKPLLHTWSLGVEEQFYLVFPLILLWLAPRGSLVFGDPSDRT
jgi:peptidoglycan/LPS O-acetylase OafA/YrhL